MITQYRQTGMSLILVKWGNHFLRKMAGSPGGQHQPVLELKMTHTAGNITPGQLIFVASIPFVVLGALRLLGVA